MRHISRLRASIKIDVTALALFVCVLGWFVAQQTAQANTVPELRQQLHRPVPGGVGVIQVVSLDESPNAPEVYLNNQRVLVLSDQSSWWAVVGIPLTTEPGSVSLAAKTGQRSWTIPVEIKPFEYKSQHITLKDRTMVSPPPKTLERIQSELAEQTAAYGTYSEKQPSNLIFDPPVPGRLSSPFGLQRFFNGEPRNPHSGLDFAAPKGTPVKSPADGRVLLIGDYYFNGLTIFIDHGQGVISMFCHLSEINLLPGDVVKRGDIVGAVGNTGRSTGPHLHWNVSLNNARVDPALFLRRR
ncbi:MAG: peptidoglycan DD-metalloendopeptidase family protein [Burkholderiaceae bacterium]|nr:peptidoglycan DD-metalloendopeptidase family protein [Burkholderiaceae bacterium]MCD8517508.1 peptidoglycan DD-metalloendopeptidase family protein [Burkholderiaceae bacterium]MCD8537892.1 peptidoglycan DD-metalloendopeptidase family protein [Burkholderiaceae bacterium]MCD8565912.1 peptidoglycan DD-metalloendopeptidase family protein [Burkholderiaceae bacterium]